jgi:hypothetical protein
MEANKTPMETVRAMMIETLEKSRSATQNYFDLFETTIRDLPSAQKDPAGEFKAYMERQVAANHGFVEKLLRAKDFQEAFRIQTEYLQSQLKLAAEDMTRFGSKLAGSIKRSAG